MPPLLARALVALCLIWGGAWLEIGALIALGFEAALRPGDLLYLLRSDLRFAHESGTLGSCRGFGRHGWHVAGRASAS